MEAKESYQKARPHPSLIQTLLTRPTRPDQPASCRECPSNEQDIDTYPCATCHTRN